MVPPVPQYMHWSDRPITWSRVDHPAVMPNPGSYALVLDCTFSSKRLTCRFSRVLVNGGNSINILYLDTLRKLRLKETDVLPNSTVFHGIVLGQSCSPIGKIQLDVLFGDKAHFRRESILFEVVDLRSPYHVLLGRPAPAKFMDILHYAFLKIKMPGPKGFITIAGDYKKSLECAQDSSRLADAMVIAEEKRQTDRLVAQATEQPAIHSPPFQSAGEGSFKSAKETKQVPLDPANPKQCVTIGAGLSPK
ncbi:hypothetical protein ZWY2020_003766 [Hordeum vulgare]|nr:hypothetical protein ZWY2020_003766 [Hordeum vulgare]